MGRNIVTPNIDSIVSLAKRRGIIFPGSDIYGGLGNTWDYGPLGVELKNNVKQSWWKSMVQQNPNIYGMDSSILMNPKVWEVSGHTNNFSDPLSECKVCHSRYRSDELIDPTKCLKCEGDLTPERQFNLMFKTFVGPLEDKAAQIWLRPETAQGIFINFKNIVNSMHPKLPFGIAQIGKSFRNEITPGNFIYKTREFEQMEMEFFVSPESDAEWYEYWVNTRFDWYSSIGIREQNLRLREHSQKELAHYAKATKDIEFLFPWGWGELEGIANRTDFDLSTHDNGSEGDLKYFDQIRQDHYFPYVIEPAAGVDRTVLALLLDAYDEEPLNNEKNEIRSVLKLHPKMSPITVAILPLSRNDLLVPKAKTLIELLQSQFKCSYDDAQSIGKRYRRQDEIGTPLCVTVDFETVNTDDAVTVRHRDTMEQERIPSDNLVKYIQDQLEQYV